MYRLLIILRYADYRPFTCPICYDWYDSYGDVAIWDRLLALVGRVLTYSRRKLRECDQKRLYPVLWFDWTTLRNKFTVISWKKRMLVTTRCHVL